MDVGVEVSWHLAKYLRMLTSPLMGDWVRGETSSSTSATELQIRLSRTWVVGG